MSFTLKLLTNMKITINVVGIVEFLYLVVVSGVYVRNKRLSSSIAISALLKLDRKTVTYYLTITLVGIPNKGDVI